MLCRHEPAVQKCDVHADRIRDDTAGHAGGLSGVAQETRQGERPRAILTVRGQNWGEERQRRGNDAATCLALQRHHQQALGGQLQRKADGPNDCERPPVEAGAHGSDLPVSTSQKTVPTRRGRSR